MKKFLFLGLVALMAAGISSCSDDAVADQSGNTTKPLDSDQSFFVNIAVQSAGTATRAEGDEDPDVTKEPGFDKGTEIENHINTIFLVFYDQNGDRVATTQVRKENASVDTDGRNESENHIYGGVVQIDIKHGSLPPAYVMAFINPITATNFEINPEFASLKAMQQVTRDKIIDDQNRFAMSKSVYYGTDRVTGRQDEKIVATPLTNGQLFTTKESAEAALTADAGSVVDVYVERYAVKVQFSLDKDANKTLELTGTDYTLEFVPEYWAVNSYESTTYATKSFFSVTADGHVDYENSLSFATLNRAFGGTDNTAPWFWNSAQHHRCYWAQSPAYYANKYPRVADDILDKQTTYGPSGGYALGYYSYKEMQDNASNKLNAKARNLNASDQSTMPIYARENTVAGTALQNAAKDPFASPKAAIPSVVLVGHYNLKDKSGAAVTTSRFYIMGNATNGYTLFKNNDEMLNYFVQTTVPFATEEGGETFFNYVNGEFTNYNYKDYFVIEHPKASVRGSLAEENSDNQKALILDSRFVTVQIDKAKLRQLSEDYPLYAYLNGKYVLVDENNVDAVNQQMMYTAGMVQGFDGGKAYFTIPIKHLGFYRAGNTNAGKNANDKDFKWTDVRTGDFGLVRNHVYSIIVDNIMGLGNGIPNPNDPIVPPTDPEEYFIGARLIILNWAIVPSQHVTL